MRTLSDTRPVTITTFSPAARSKCMPRPSWMSKRLSSTGEPSVLAEVDAAVGEDAVHVEPDEADALRERLVDHSAARVPEVHGAEHERHRARASGTMFGPVARRVIRIGVRLEE